MKIILENIEIAQLISEALAHKFGDSVERIAVLDIPQVEIKVELSLTQPVDPRFTPYSGDFVWLRREVLHRYAQPDGKIPQKIDAIRFVRTATSCGLKEGKEYIDALSEGRLHPEQYLPAGVRVNRSV